MKKVIEINTVDDYNKMFGFKTYHPLVSLVDFSKTETLLPAGMPINYNLFVVFFKTGNVCELRYGRNVYDYQDGTLVFLAPGQVLSVADNGQPYKPSGLALFFHPDLLFGTSLSNHMKDYSFFSYDIHEALHLSEQDREIVYESFGKIDFEIKNAVDKHSKRLIVSNIELFLNYCIRFYDRQFIIRDKSNHGVVEKFESVLDAYFNSEKPLIDGIPSVAYFAQELNLSANYFGDLIKRETGKNALEYIHFRMIQVAKEKIFNPDKNLSEIAYEMGFKYPQHFTRFFKQQVGQTPSEYRNLN